MDNKTNRYFDSGIGGFNMERDSPSTSNEKPYTLQTVRMRLMAKKSKEEL
jgi:hypothetical protein